jgi:hypothetical protein
MDVLFTSPLGFNDLKIVKNMGQDIEDYKPAAMNQPHILIAKKEIAEKGYLENREIEYVMVDHTLKVGNPKRICTKGDFVGTFDKIYYWNDKVFRLMKTMLEIVHPNENWDKFEMKKEKNENQLTLF